MNRHATLVSVGLIILAGCQTMAAGDDAPARITNPTAASRAALQQAVNDALHTEVVLADDALTHSNLLIIERKPPETMQGRLATGRNMDSAIQFRLVVNDSDCILIDTRDQTRHLLEDTTCVAE
jgi:hypothetical protein